MSNTLNEAQYSDTSTWIPKQARHEPLLSLNAEWLPPSFPLDKFVERQRLYQEYHKAFSGLFLNKPHTVNGEETELYPLRINSFRTLAERIGFVLAGEAPDNSEPVTKTTLSPKFVDFLGSKREEFEKAARFGEIVVNQTWKQSSGRAKQLEAGIITQYMGGVVFQLLWRDDREDLLLPFQIKLLSPDLFMPVYDGDDPWNLLEGFVLHKITWQEAKEKYGIADAAKGKEYIYLEHWRKDVVSISINGQYITHPEGYLIKDIEHPFGEVPLYYVPALRTNDYFGISMVERIKGLVGEYNSRFADNGDAVYKNINRRVWVANTTKDVKLKTIKDESGNVVGDYIDMGEAPSLGKGNSPQVEFEEPPDLTDSTLRYPDKVFIEMLRQTGLSNVAFGEDEGSQRSGLTLAFRMWPVTSLTRAQRMNFEIALNMIAVAIVRAFKAKETSTQIKRFYNFFPEAPKFPDDFSILVDVAQNWPPQIPRDRDQEVQEVIARQAAGHFSPAEANRKLGEKNPEELAQGYVDAKAEEAKAMMQANPPMEGGVGGNGKAPDVENKQIPNLRKPPTVDLGDNKTQVAVIDSDERE